MKRLFDLAFSVICCLFIIPILGIIAAIIKLTSPGPIIFAQTRIGLNKRPFMMRKFRTMVIDAEKLGGHFTQKNDPRITPIGRFLRRTKLDELPQLYNVITGDMSLVGPRPDTPKRVDKYTPEMREILRVRPGITSIASLHFRNEESIFDITQGDPDDFYIKYIAPAKIEIAMAHVRHNSLWFDLQVLLLTLWHLTLGRFFPHTEHPVISHLRQTACQLSHTATNEG
jgi:lipopolysaccharide/colanic/teichoic acid biosynthesis glycosyltransferase